MPTVGSLGRTEYEVSLHYLSQFQINNRKKQDIQTRVKVIKDMFGNKSRRSQSRLEKLKSMNQWFCE